MNKERVQLLIDALRSGRYTKAIGQLKIGSYYCTTGVACDIYRKSHRKTTRWMGDQFVVLPENKCDRNAPDLVLDWFGINRSLLHKIIDWNDSERLGFDTIAQRLEALLEKAL